MSMLQPRRTAFTYDDRALEVRVLFDDVGWTTWIFEAGRRLCPVASVELETVQEAMPRGVDVIGDLMEAAIVEVTSGAVALPPEHHG